LSCRELAVEQKLVATDLRAPQDLAARIHGGLGGPLRPAHPGELRLGLRTTALVEEILVDLELNAVGPEPIGEPDGKVLRHGSVAQPDARDCAYG
jgi:hypothetical protein